MAEDLKRVGLVFKSDGAVDFKKTMGEINTAVLENRNAFKQATASYDKNTSAMQKLQDRQKFLVKQTDIYSDKVDVLKTELKALENEEERNEQAIRKKHAQITQTEIQLDKYKKDLENVNKELKSGTANIEAYAKKMGKTGEKLTSAGKKLSTGVTAPLAGIGVASAKTAMDFETSMAKVSTIADETEVPIDELRQGILDLSSDTGQSAEELNEALYQAISASVDTGDAVDFLGTAVKAAVGGFTDNATAVDGLTSVLNAYGMEATEVDKIANQMLITQNLGKTTFGELASSIGQVTPVASALGITTEELLSSLAVTTAQGLGTSQSITALKAAMSNIIKPSKEASEAANALGIEFSVSALQSKGWMGFLKEVRDKLAEVSPEYERLFSVVESGNKKMTELEQAGKKNTDEYKRLKTEVKESSKQLELLTQANDSTIGGFATMFGSVEGLNSVLMLTSEQGMQKYSEAMQEMGTNATALDDAYSKMSDTTAHKIQQAMQDINNAGIEIGGVLLPIISEVVGKVRDVVKAFSEMSEGQKQTIVIIGLLTALIGPLVMAIGGLCSGISNVADFVKLVITHSSTIPKLIGMIGTGAKALWAILSANPLGVIIALITGVIVVIINLWNTNEAFRNKVIEIWGSIKQAFSDAIEAVKGFMNGLGDKFDEIKDKIKNWASETAQRFESWKTETYGKITSWVSNAKSSFNDWRTNVVSTISNWKDAFTSNVRSGLESAYETIRNKLESIKSKFQSIFDSAKRIVRDSIDRIKGFFDFDWSLPHIPLPHFSVSGSFSLKPLRVPSFGISWYAKGGILNSPTIFGMDGGNLLGGGEAGKEAVLPIHLLKDYIREENMANNGVLVKALKEALAELNLTAENNIYLGDRKLGEVVTDMVLKKMDSRSTSLRMAKGW